MEDEKIYELFMEASDHPGQDDEAARRVFSTLVQSTMKYRDQMLADRGVVLMVEDVRVTLRWLLPSLFAGQLPATDDRTKLGLLRIWLDDLKLF